MSYQTTLADRINPFALYATVADARRAVDARRVPAVSAGEYIAHVDGGGSSMCDGCDGRMDYSNRVTFNTGRHGNYCTECMAQLPENPAHAPRTTADRSHPANAAEPLASEAQHNFIGKLVLDRDTSRMNPAYTARLADILAGRGKPLTKAGASILIDGLRTLPRKCTTLDYVAPARVTYDVPAGHYALDGSGANETVFYRVDRPEEGKWAGFTFISRLQGPDEERVPRNQKDGILARIAADVRGASARYGHAIGRCGVCNRRLTNDASRAAGIGPKCSANLGW
jgi:hypothetical protein